MKQLFLLLLLTISPVFAKDKQTKPPLPKFEESLPTEKFFNKQALPYGYTYGFATNKSLAEIKPLLLKPLGDGWKLEVAPAHILKQLQQNNPKMNFVAVGKLVHKNFSGYDIGVTLCKMPKSGNKEFKTFSHLLSIVPVDLEKAKNISK